MASDGAVERYVQICRSLKKRFMKKPNITEARDNFYSLGKQLLSSGNAEYAVSCYVSASQCEEQLGNTVGEISALTKAASLFLQLEREQQKLCISSQERYMCAGIDCYNRAISRLTGANKRDLAVKLSLELGCLLLEMGHIPDAEPHFERAASMMEPGNIAFQVVALRKLSYCRTYTLNYTGALETLDTLVDLINNFTAGPEEGGGSGNMTSHLHETLQYCELTTILLLLILDTPHKHLSPAHRNLLERYSTVPVDLLDRVPQPERFCTMVEIVVATQHKDVGVLTTLRDKLYPRLSGQQNELFSELVKKVETVSLVLL